MQKVRVFLTGVGGQGTLTATTILAQTALACGLPVTSGEIHGMAQRGGVVESTVLIGGYASPRIGPGEAHVLLGFEPLETLRALPYLAPQGTIVSSSEAVPPIGVTMGREAYPDLPALREAVSCSAGRSVFVPILSLARQVGTEQAANMVLTGAAVALGALPFSLDDLVRTVKAFLKPKIVELNLKAIELGAQAVRA